MPTAHLREAARRRLRGVAIAPLTSIEQSGQQEMLNWMCLAGAMAELERLPDMTRFVGTYVFNSNKCFAAFSDRT